MDDKFHYRLTKATKNEIAQNLIDILQKDASITKDTRIFISNWLYTDYTGKRKAFYDVWDIVLKNYLPTTRPVLFRTCNRIGKNGKIASFTGRLECARRISDGKGSLLICDTNESLKFDEEISNPGEYRYTFYPLVSVLMKARDEGQGELSEGVLRFIGEDEYIMRIDSSNMHGFKWIKSKF
jgi:hypothetical protein